MQKENILKDPYYQKYMNKENKKRNIRLIILSIDNIIYEYYDPNYSYGQNNNEYSFFDAPIQLYGDKIIDSIYYRKIISLI